MKRILLTTIVALAVGAASAQSQTAPSSSAGAADNTNSKSAPTMRNWMMDRSRTNNGYVSRQAYMEEMGRRWDAMDRDKSGLSMDQIDTLHGDGRASPGMVKEQTNATNPSGTEVKGQNSGGK